MKCMLKDGFRYLLVFFVLSAYLCSVVPVYAQADQPGADGADGSDSSPDDTGYAGSGDEELPADDSDGSDDGSGSQDGDGAAAGDGASGSGDDENDSSLAGTASAPGAGPSTEECSPEYACAGEPLRLCYRGRWIDVLDYEVNCVDGIDNDCDGSVDSEDTDCYQAEKPVKISGPAPVCGNGICEATETQSSCPEDCSKGKTIIIRSDDIGPWWSVDNVIYLTDFLNGMDIPQTLGIIPVTGDGTIQLEEDVKLVSYLRSVSADPKVEIGISGLTHGYNEFLGLSQAEAEEKIGEAKQMIADSVYAEPVTFMPPYYAYDESTLYAAKNQDMEYFSAGWNAIDMGHGFSEYPPGLWNVPATTDFYDWGTGSFYSAGDIEESCEDAMDTFGTCVIVLYHHTFVDQDNNIDPQKVALLEEVMEWVKLKEQQGVELKTIGKHRTVKPPEPSDKFIVFRSDDLAAFWSVSSAIAITETLRERGVPQVVSVVPTNVGYTLADDHVISDYLDIIKDDASIEIALHGYDHSEHEFRDISYADAMFKVQTGLDILQDVPGVTPVTFVPPYHDYNENTLLALKMNNINIISSGYDDFVRGRAFKVDEHGILHLPAAAEFYNWGENRHNSAQEIENSCEYALENYNVCIIMLHHHMFVDSEGNLDLGRVKVLTDVIEWAKNKEQEGAADIVRLKDIDVDDL